MQKEFFGNKKIDSNNEEIINNTVKTLLDSNRLYDIVNLLLFNEFDFGFAFLKSPAIVDNDINLFLSANGKSFLMPRNGTAGFDFEPRAALQKFIEHPEHLSGYLVRHKDRMYGEYFYHRGNFDYRIMLGRILTTFMILTETKSLNDVDELIKTSITRRNQTHNKSSVSLSISDVSFLEDDMFLDSYKNRSDNSVLSLQPDINNIFRRGFFEIERFTMNNIYCNASFNIQVMEGNDHIYFESWVPQPLNEFKTDLSKPISIISRDDNIADLIFRLAVDIDADVFKAAVGYTYDSGLKQLLPSLKLSFMRRFANRTFGIRPSEIIIGGLQKYPLGAKIKELNRNTAHMLNDLCSNGIIKAFTYPKAFYHGKFYYLSGRDKSYVIMGSSNITQSAFSSNFELDVLYCFDNNEDNELKNSFLEWFDNLREECVELPILDEERFASNTFSDERGTNKGDSFYRTLSSAEEQERYNLLMELNPSDFLDKPLKKKPYCYSFRDCTAFIYEDRHKLVLEEFKYGRACYVFSADSIDDVIPSLSGKSKMDIKENSDLLVSVIEHDDNYEERIREVLGA